MQKQILDFTQMMIKFSILFQVDDQSDTNIASLLSDRNFDGKALWVSNFKIELRPHGGIFFVLIDSGNSLCSKYRRYV